MKKGCQVAKEKDWWEGKGLVGRGIDPGAQPRAGKGPHGGRQTAVGDNAGEPAVAQLGAAMLGLDLSAACGRAWDRLGPGPS